MKGAYIEGFPPPFFEARSRGFPEREQIYCNPYKRDFTKRVLVVANPI